MPKAIYLHITKNASKNIGITFSNVAGPKSPITYQGYKCTKLCFVPPPNADTCFGFSIISIGGVVKASI